MLLKYLVFFCIHCTIDVGLSLNIRKTHAEKQNLVNTRFELLKTRQQFCGDISTIYKLAIIFFSYILLNCLLVMVF